jgi:hypothetical protein
MLPRDPLFYKIKLCFINHLLSVSHFLKTDESLEHNLKELLKPV